MFQRGVMAFSIETSDPKGPNYGEEIGSGGGSDTGGSNGDNIANIGGGDNGITDNNVGTGGGQDGGAGGGQDGNIGKMVMRSFQGRENVALNWNINMSQHVRCVIFVITLLSFSRVVVK